MSKVDWSLAPEEATHFLPEQVDRGWVPCFYKKLGDTWYARNIHDVEWYSDHDYVDVFVPLLIERPAQPNQWSGPQDGLPPVGMIVQVWDKEPHKFYAKHVGKSVSILAHRVGSYGDPVAVYCVKADDGTDDYHALVEDCFRPVQEIIDARETAIREFMDVVGTDCRVTASKAVDAGFKREGK